MESPNRLQPQARTPRRTSRKTTELQPTRWVASTTAEIHLTPARAATTRPRAWERQARASNAHRGRMIWRRPKEAAVSQQNKENHNVAQLSEKAEPANEARSPQKIVKKVRLGIAGGDVLPHDKRLVKAVGWDRRGSGLPHKLRVRHDTNDDTPEHSTSPAGTGSQGNGGSIEVSPISTDPKTIERPDPIDDPKSEEATISGSRHHDRDACDTSSQIEVNDTVEDPVNKVRDALRDVDELITRSPLAIHRTPSEDAVGTFDEQVQLGHAQDISAESDGSPRPEFRKPEVSQSFYPVNLAGQDLSFGTISDAHVVDMSCCTPTEENTEDRRLSVASVNCTLEEENEASLQKQSCAELSSGSDTTPDESKESDTEPMVHDNSAYTCAIDIEGLDTAEDADSNPSTTHAGNLFAQTQTTHDHGEPWDSDSPVTLEAFRPVSGNALLGEDKAAGALIFNANRIDDCKSANPVSGEGYSGPVGKYAAPQDPPANEGSGDVSPSSRKSLHSTSAPPTPGSVTVKVNLNDDESVLHAFLSRAKASKAARIAKRSSISHKRDSDVVKTALASPKPTTTILDDLEMASPTAESKSANTATMMDADSANDELMASPTLTLDLTAFLPTYSQHAGSPTAAHPAPRRSKRGTSPKIVDATVPDHSQPIQVAPQTITVRRSDGADRFALQKTEAQKLSQSTRSNTHRNKSGSVSVRSMLMRLKGENAGSAASPTALLEDAPSADASRKGVRWNEELVSFFQEDDAVPARAEESALVEKAVAAGKNMGPQKNVQDGKEDPSAASKPRAKRAKALGALNGTPAISKVKRTVAKEVDAASAEGTNNDKEPKARSNEPLHVLEPTDPDNTAAKKPPTTRTRAKRGNEAAVDLPGPIPGLHHTSIPNATAIDNGVHLPAAKRPKRLLPTPTPTKAKANPIPAERLEQHDSVEAVPNNLQKAYTASSGAELVNKKDSSAAGATLGQRRSALPRRGPARPAR